MKFEEAKKFVVDWAKKHPNADIEHILYSEDVADSMNDSEFNKLMAFVNRNSYVSMSGNRYFYGDIR